MQNSETERERERLVVTVEEAAKMLGISRATAYTLASTGGLPVIRISARRLIVPRKALDALLATAGAKAEGSSCEVPA